MTARCAWCGEDPLYVRYHDEEWGVPVHDERTLFEFLILEGAQAGLSWITVLRKREHYREALDGFDPERIARYSDKKLERLLENPGLIRNRLKIASLRTNARAFLEIRHSHGSFERYLWQHVGDKPMQNARKNMGDVPAKTLESDALSKDLVRRGFKFVGSTIVYAYMQAVGLVNDHTIDCFRHAALSRQTPPA
ncbi:MAG: DNA-3-methyladenine glycosylase I [Burkholderiales bacterium]